MPQTETYQTTTETGESYIFTVYIQNQSGRTTYTDVTVTNTETQKTYLLHKDRESYSEYHNQFKQFLVGQLSNEYEVNVDEDGDELSEFEALTKDVETHIESRTREIIKSIVDISIIRNTQTKITIQTTENNTETLVFTNIPVSENEHTHTIRCPNCNIKNTVCGKNYTTRSFTCKRCQTEYTQDITAVDATGVAYCEVCNKHHPIITKAEQFTQTSVNITTDEPVGICIQCVCGSRTNIDGRINQHIQCENCDRNWELSLTQVID